MIRLFKVNMSLEALAAATEVLSSGFVGQGPKVEAFEDALKAELQLPRRPVTVNSATTGLELAYRLCGIGPQSIVISTPATCLATNIPLVHLGARIAWSDVTPRGLIDPVSVKAMIADGLRPSAIVAVDWGGLPCDYHAIRAAAPGVPIIQDAAHSYLTDFSDTGMGDYVVWSFQAIKSLTCGDGGAVLTPDAQQDRARMLRWYGLDRSKTASMRCTQQIEELGWKWHMNDIAAAIGMANMPAAREAIKVQRENARKIISNSMSAGKVVVPNFDPRSSYWLLTVITPRGQQQAFINHMDVRGIEASLVHARNDIQNTLMHAAVDQRELIGVDEFCSREVCIPCGWWLTEEDKRRIVDAIVDFDYV